MGRVELTLEEDNIIDSLLNFDEDQSHPAWRSVILSMQVGNVLKNTRYMRAYPAMESTYLASQERDLGDLLAQTLLLARLQKLDVDKVLTLGIQSLKDFLLR